MHESSGIGVREPGGSDFAAHPGQINEAVGVFKVLSMLVAGVAALLMTLSAGSVLAAAAPPAAEQVPQYELDTSWPRLPLPNKWALGLVNGIYVDAKNHLWLFHSPELLPKYITGAANSPPSGKCCVPAPPIIEFDAQGNVLRAWGGPGPGYDWPNSGHGMYVDYKGNVWIGGSQTRPGADGSPPDGMVLKFTKDGKFIKQFGFAYANAGSMG